MVDPIPFVPFRRHHEVEIFQTGSLPHWRQEGCTYFVTFRTADSLPRKVLARLREQREITGDEFDDSERWHHKIDEILDWGAGECRLRNTGFRTIVVEALRHFDPERLRLGDFVVMPNHVHALLTPATGESLDGLLTSIKSYSGRRIHELLETSGQFWQRNSYDRIVRDQKELERFQKYIRDNPVKIDLPVTSFSLGEANYSFHDRV